MNEATWRSAIARVLGGNHLERADAAAVMDAMMSGDLGDVRTAAFLSAMAAKGPTVDELVGLASVMRARAVSVAAPDGPLLDTCGTGGSGLETPNVSTMAAFVVAAAGVKVAKHGNRASSGRCGSSDLLEALGVPVVIGPEAASALLDEVGLAFLFAPRYHPAVKAVVPVRKQLGFRTVFNFLGPLCNPAGADLQLLGVSDPAYAPRMAQALAALGSTRVLVVHGADDGLDEVTLSGATRTWLVEDGRVTEGEFRPTDAGIQTAPFAAFAGGGRAENAAIFTAVMAGEPGPHADLVALNAGAALWVAGVVANLAEGVTRAQGLLADGAARARFDRYREEAARAAAA